MPYTKLQDWLRPTLAATLVLGFAASGGSDDLARKDGLKSIWREGAKVAISVEGGKAEFDIPEMERDGSALVVVSSLSRQPGPFPIKLTASTTKHLRPLTLESESRGKPQVTKLAKPRPQDPAPDFPPPPERTFYLLVRDGDVASASNYLPVPGILRAVGDRIQVYVDSHDLNRVNEAVLGEVVNTFDRHIYPTATKNFGHARDVDGDGRFTVLISSWLNRLAGGRHSVDGFVRGADLDPDLRAPFSNHCDMMYLNASLAPGPHLKTVLAHEYTHAVTYTAKSFAGPAGERAGQDEEGWLDEALAHLAEDLHGFSRTNLDYRVSAFLSSPSRYQLVVDDYYSADLFRSHGNRGGTYLFLRWCVEHFGDSLLTTLVRSPKRGAPNLEAATGWTFASLYREWSTNLYMSGIKDAEPEAKHRPPLDVRSPLDGWPLAGPRSATVVPGSDPIEWMSAGTSSHFLVIEPDRAGHVRIEVEAPLEAALQVTAVRLPAGLPHLNVQLRTSEDRDGTLVLRANLAESRGTAVELNSIAWEPLIPAANPHSAGTRRGELEPGKLVQYLGTSQLPARGRLQSKPIRLEGFRSGSGPLVVKVLGTDAKGRPVSGWAEIADTPREDEVVAKPGRDLK